MHYLLPFFNSESHQKLFVTIYSSILLSLAIFYIAYSSRCGYLLFYASQYQLTAYRDPLLSFMLFYGVQGIIVHTINIIEIWLSDRLPLSKNIKWWITWWMMFVNAGFTYTSAIGGASNRKIVQNISLVAQSYVSKSFYLPKKTITYYSDWIDINRFSKALIVFQFVLGIPLITLLILGLVLKIKSSGDSKMKVMSQIRGSGSTTVAIRMSQSEHQISRQ